MEEATTKTGNLAEDARDLTQHIGDFVETYVKLTSLKVAQKSINFLSTVVNFTALVFISFLVIMFLSFGLAWWLGAVVNNRAGGFFIVGGFYLLVLIFIAAMGKKTVIPLLRNIITRIIYE